jgi:hypothetical protein
MADGDTTMMNGKKYVSLAGRWQPADPDPVDRVEATRRPAVEANARQNLKSATGGAQGGMTSVQDQLLDHLLTKLKPDPKTDPKGYMQDLEFRIADMETKAKEVKKSKSGNIQAEQTYMQVADLLRKKLSAMQSEQIGAASPPGEGQ